MKSCNSRQYYTLVGCLLFVGFFLVSCSKESGEGNSSNVLQTDYHRKFDSVDQVIWHLYVTNPDSAILLLEYYNKTEDSLQFPERKVNRYLHLCEIYQYRKPDYVKSVEALGMAVRQLLELRSDYVTNPYMYIDIGNVFFKLRYYPESCSFYRTALNFSEKLNLWHGKSLAYQNMALCCSELGRNDSAIFYLALAEKEIRDSNRLMMVQNRKYLAGLLLKMNRTEELQQMLFRSFQLMFDAKKSFNLMKGVEKDQSILVWYEIMTELHQCQAVFYNRQGDFDRTAISLDSALFYADKTSSLQLLASLYFSRALFSGKHNSPGFFLADVDSAARYMGKTNNLNLQKAFADSMAILCRTNGLNEKAVEFNKLSMETADSIIHQRASFGLISNMMQLASTAAVQALQKLQMEEASKSRIIMIQRRALMVFLILIVIIAVIMGILFMQKTNLRIAYRAMVTQIQTSIRVQEELKGKKNRKIDAIDFPSELLEQIMVQERPYLNMDLTLPELALLLKTNQTYLSNYLNNCLKVDFSQYINTYRINEACRLLEGIDTQNLTIDSLAGMSGFKTKSTFYTAFKKVTGMTPTAYMKMNRESKG